MKILNKKIVKIALIIIVGVSIFLYALGLGIMKYDQWHGQKRVRELAEELERIEKEQYEKKKADTIGGKTPQETLEMFIGAVENGDYELASRYFVLEKQKEELKSLQNSPKKNIENVMCLLEQVKISEGSYSLNKDQFVVRKPILVSFILYPSGNWKIEEI